MALIALTLQANKRLCCSHTGLTFLRSIFEQVYDTYFLYALSHFSNMLAGSNISHALLCSRQMEVGPNHRWWPVQISTKPKRNINHVIKTMVEQKSGKKTLS